MGERLGRRKASARGSQIQATQWTLIIPVPELSKMTQDAFPMLGPSIELLQVIVGDKEHQYRQ